LTGSPPCIAWATLPTTGICEMTLKQALAELGFKHRRARGAAISGKFEVLDADRNIVKVGTSTDIRIWIRQLHKEREAQE